ncbi:uncharacterized protein LOC129778657 [Toxorhynchites rutilus septentrionalis]|uniref:uncharacterized protein LOC129778657 n=1 Tax=Toxorhynchites rutilus septentrionalis TaxID=329112 RepID=UPI00247A4AB9|nr:uncharacterized protein LOC129778657 [Toxorhynchites rutilus septentrionalis]
MEIAKVPSRNPLTYCRLCLSQVNLLTVLQAEDGARSPHKEWLQKLFHYAKIAFNAEEDYPSAVCDLCITQFNDFHTFRRKVVSNHTMVKLYRRNHGDEIVIPKEEVKEEAQEDEEEGFLIDIIDEDQLIKIKEENDDGISDAIFGKAHETIKEVDVYHMDGELRKLVVKQEPISPVRPTSAPRKSAENGDIKLRLGALPTMHILNKKVPSTNVVKQLSVPAVKIEPLDSTPIAPKRPAGTILNQDIKEKRLKSSVVSCWKCKAVFNSHENLIIHEREDHGMVRQHKPPPVVSSGSKPCAQATLFKCTKCHNSFVQESNYEQHLTTCKVSLLSKLNPAQITIKRTKVPASQPSPPSSSAGINNLNGKNNDHQVVEHRLRCPHCPLTYKTKHFLQKHLQDVHRIATKEEVLQCKICNLTYSCSEDLKLHNQALHRRQCEQCTGEFKNCVHSNVDTKTVGNRVLVNKQLVK